MTPDTVILNMLREVIDLRVCRPVCWAFTFGREAGDMERLIGIVAEERATEQVAA